VYDQTELKSGKTLYQETEIEHVNSTIKLFFNVKMNSFFIHIIVHSVLGGAGPLF